MPIHEWLRELPALHSADAEPRLRQMLVDAGIDLAEPQAGDLEVAWSVMESFAGLTFWDVAPAVEDGDLLLAQFGTYDRGLGQEFSLDVTRNSSSTMSTVSRAT
jgi:hypothetical protein